MLAALIYDTLFFENSQRSQVKLHLSFFDFFLHHHCSMFDVHVFYSGALLFLVVLYMLISTHSLIHMPILYS